MHHFPAKMFFFSLMNLVSYNLNFLTSCILFYKEKIFFFFTKTEKISRPRLQKHKNFITDCMQAFYISIAYIYIYIYIYIFSNAFLYFYLLSYIYIYTYSTYIQYIYKIYKNIYIKQQYKYWKGLFFYWILLSEMCPITEVKCLYLVFDCAQRWVKSVCLWVSWTSCFLCVMTRCHGVKQIGIKSLMKSAETQIAVCVCVWSAVIITSCLGVGGDLLFCTALCDKTAASPGTVSLIMKGNRHFEERLLILTGIDVIEIEFSFRSWAVFQFTYCPP